MCLTVEKTSRKNKFEGKSNDMGEDSRLKIDEETQSLGEDTADKSCEGTSFDFEGVRFSPKVIEFIDAFEGKQFSTKIVIQNVGKNSVKVTIGEPSSFIFQLKKPIRDPVTLASGASVIRHITYSYHRDDLVQRSQIPVRINGHLVDYPIVVKKAVPEIEVQPTKLDFKLNVGASAKSGTLTIINTGGKRAKFEIDVGKNDLELVVNPFRGTVKAKSQVQVAVEMMGMNEGEFFKELWITTNEVSIRVPVLVKVVRPRLEIVHPVGTEDFTLIDFGPTFAGTQRVRSFVLRNYSVETTLFIILAEVNGELQFLKKARKAIDAFDLFQMTSEEGLLDPFECRILTILFRPKKKTKTKGWYERDYEKKTKKPPEYVVFFRINRVHCMERDELVKIERKSSSIGQDTNDSLQHSDTKRLRHSDFTPESIERTLTEKAQSLLSDTVSLENKVLRLCLHGVVVEPEILIQPNELHFGEIWVGESQNKVIRITNTNSISVKFSYQKTINVKMEPKEGWLKPGGALEALVSVNPKFMGKFRTKMKLYILAQSDAVLSSDQSTCKVATCHVFLIYNSAQKRKLPEPQLGLGISPLVVDEVGLHKESVKFGTCEKAPFAAVLLSQQLQPEWMKKEKRTVELKEMMMALPNDRPRQFQTWPKNQICRTIFTGFPRYSPPADPKYALSAEEMEKKKEHQNFWMNYLNYLKELRKTKSPNLQEQKSTEFCQKHGNMKNIMAIIESMSKTESGEWCRNFVQKKASLPREVLVPLSPSYLSNVRVEPKLINFYTVAAESLVQETLTIENLNTFATSIRFIPGKSAVTVLNANTIVIPPNSFRKLHVSFQTKDLGRYYGFLDYVINGSHEFKITISALVTSKTLFLGDKHLEFGNYPVENVFQPRSLFLPLSNLLQSPIKYQWVIPQDCPFIPQIQEGEIPPRSTLLTEVVLELGPLMSFYYETKILSEGGSMEIIKFWCVNKRVRVNFVTNRIELGDIPLNLPTTTYPVIRNDCFHDVFFDVIQWSPMPGVEVCPKSGVIKARSFFYLTVKIQVPVIMNFSFDVTLQILWDNTISTTISGNVALPVIRVKPTEIEIKKICPQCTDTMTVCVENTGKTLVEIMIDFKDCPEYSVANEESPIVIEPKKYRKINIKFEPKDVARNLFYLPIIINNILGPPLMQDPKTETLSYYIASKEHMFENHGEVFISANSDVTIPCVSINCTVSPSLLKFSAVSINFRQHNRSQFQPQRIIITNESADEVAFCIRNDDLGEDNSSPFTLTPVDEDAVEFRKKSIKAELKHKEQLVLEARFRPQKPGEFNAALPVFIRNYNSGFVYNYIRLKGELKKPKLYSECSEIHFCPLPLNVGCDVVLSICAENYQTFGTISCFIWDIQEECESTSEVLTTSWVSEPNVEPCPGTQIFQLQLAFRSSSPIAIKNYLVFVASSGECCVVLVTAVADNSAVTAHVFLSTKVTKYKLVRDTPPPKTWQPLSDSSVSVLRNRNKKEGSKETASSGQQSMPSNFTYLQSIDKGPRLVIQLTKSMSRPTQLSFVYVVKNLQDCKTKRSSSTAIFYNKNKFLNSSISASESYINVRSFSNWGDPRKNDQFLENNQPISFVGETVTAKYFRANLSYIERWIYEVMMHCEQYFMIPSSFQKLVNREKHTPLEKKKFFSTSKTSQPCKSRVERDFFQLLENILGVNVDISDFLPEKLVHLKAQTPILKMKQAYLCFSKLLCFLQQQGCFLPHVRPEHLLDYDTYLLYLRHNDSEHTFKWKSADSEKTSTGKVTKIDNEFPKNPMSSRHKPEKDELPLETASLVYSWKRALFDDPPLAAPDSNEASRQEEGRMEDEEILQMENFRLVLEDLEFSYRYQIMSSTAFEVKSTQAWMDIVIQVFKNFILKKVVYKRTIPKVTVVDMEDRLQMESTNLNSNSTVSSDVDPSKADLNEASVDTIGANESNLYSLQERILLSWLNHHLHVQLSVLWANSKEAENCDRVLNNFDKDLSDSVALLSLTASHCPYIVSDFFSDVFFKADTPSKLHHNAGKLITAWRTLNVGMTVETKDIVSPNSLFMIMLLTHLYDVLPTLHPRSLIRFSAPLSSEVTRTITLKNMSKSTCYYQAMFFGEHEGFFHLNDPSLIELLPSKSKEVSIVFSARKIKKVTATLILSGSVVGPPQFAKDQAFYLEGEPKEVLPETEKFSFSAPMYKVICTEVTISPPYPESTVYEIWYTTRQPCYDGTDISTSMKPWSKIWNRKVARRLFLNQSEITYETGTKCSLGVTVACFTKETRFFWLLFRSAKVGDFIIMVRVEAEAKVPPVGVIGYLTQPWPPTENCLCTEQKNPKFNCPMVTQLAIPTRNDTLWNSLKAMFFRTLYPQEKSFWNEHLETNIGICLILWLLSPEEEEAVIDEFVHLLATTVQYTVKLESEKYVTVPDIFEIADVRQNLVLQLPLHLMKNAPSRLDLTLTLTSKDNKEVRRLKVAMWPPEPANERMLSHSNNRSEACKEGLDCLMRPCQLQPTVKKKTK